MFCICQYNIMSKISIRDRWWLSLRFSFLGSRTFWKNVLHTIRCKIKWATNWYKVFFDNRFLTCTLAQNTEKWNKFYMQKFFVFWLLQLYIKLAEKHPIYSCVERIKLYRLVYDSAWIVNKFQRKKSNKVKSQFSTLFYVFLKGVSSRLSPYNQE